MMIRYYSVIEFDPQTSVSQVVWIYNVDGTDDKIFQGTEQNLQQFLIKNYSTNVNNN